MKATWEEWGGPLLRATESPSLAPSPYPALLSLSPSLVESLTVLSTTYKVLQYVQYILVPSHRHWHRHHTVPALLSLSPSSQSLHGAVLSPTQSPSLLSHSHWTEQKWVGTLAIANTSTLAVPSSTVTVTVKWFSLNWAEMANSPSPTLQLSSAHSSITQYSSIVCANWLYMLLPQKYISNSNININMSNNAFASEIY